MRGLACTAALAAAFLTALPTAADSTKSLYNQGKKAEARQDYEAAHEAFKQAYDRKPTELKYRIAYLRTRFLAAASMVHRGQLARDAGKLEEALGLFERAAQVDPSSFIAQQETQRTRAMIEAASHPAAAPAPPPEAGSLRQRIENAEGPVELAPLSDQPITLKLTEDSKVLYETIGKVAGINVLFDPDYTPRRLRLELNGVTLRQALDILALESRTFWRPVTPNTIFVAADTKPKRTELEQNVVKTFYLANISTPTELQDMVNTMRTILDLAKIQQLASQNAIVVRGTPDQVALAEKLIGDIDKAKPEVIVEVAVMQVRRDRMRDLGIRPPTSASIQLQGATTTTTTGTTGTTPTPTGTTTGTTTPGTITLNNLANLRATDFIVTIPSATANFLFSDSTTRIIQNPQIRAANGVKASLKIGDRVPVATGSFQPGIGGVGINPLVNTQFTYIDVGVNVDITPTVHQGNEISLKVLLDISSVTSRVNIGGIDQPVISQRKVEHEIRLKEGEANLLGGIFEQQDVKTLSGIPGLGQLPFLKYLFASQSTEKVESEIVFLLVPHIVRGQELSELNLRVLDVGTGSAVELRRKAPPLKPATPVPQGAAAPPSATAAAATMAATTPPPPAGGAAAQAAPERPLARPAAPAAPQAPGASALSFVPAEISQAAGSTFAVNIAIAGAQDIYAVPLQISYDPASLQILNVSNGDFLSRDGQVVTLVHRDPPGEGNLQVTAARPPQAGGVSGAGAVLTITFLAKAKGQSALTIRGPVLRNSAMQAVPATATPASVTIR